VSGSGSWNSFVLKEIYQTQSGEKAGPIITEVFWLQLLAQHKTPKAALEAALQTDQMKNASPEAEDNASLLRWYDRIHLDADNFYDETLKRKATEKKDRADVKKAKVEHVLDTVKEAMAAKVEARFLDLMVPNSEYFNKAVAYLIKAPSKATAKEIKSLTDRLAAPLLVLQDDNLEFEELKKTPFNAVLRQWVIDNLANIFRTAQAAFFDALCEGDWESAFYMIDDPSCWSYVARQHVTEIPPGSEDVLDGLLGFFWSRPKRSTPEEKRDICLEAARELPTVAAKYLEFFSFDWMSPEQREKTKLERWTSDAKFFGWNWSTAYPYLLSGDYSGLFSKVDDGIVAYYGRWFY
jgi:hypothetical protein